MSEINYKAALESLLFIAGDEGLTVKQLTEAFSLSLEEVNGIIYELGKDLESPERGIQLVELADTYKLMTKREYAEYVKALVDVPANQSLSQAALETLAIIAYLQPITRTEIEEVRGVKTERPLQTLVGKAVVKEVGRAEGAGRAILYGTTKEFLDYFGLKSLEDLPPLPENMMSDGAEQEADLFFETFQEAIE